MQMYIKIISLYKLYIYIRRLILFLSNDKRLMVHPLFSFATVFCSSNRSNEAVINFQVSAYTVMTNMS